MQLPARRSRARADNRGMASDERAVEEGKGPVGPPGQSPPKPTRLGGQAVLEGVMVRADDRWAVAVRRPDGAVLTEGSEVPRWSAWGRPVPVVRGVVALVSTIALGMRALGWSRQILEGGEEEHTSRAQVVGATVVSLTFFVTLFAVGPAAVARVLAGHGVWFGVVETLARLVLFVGYVAAIGRVPGVRRTFEYHGAEHQAIAAFEAGAPLDVASVRSFSPRHARCGTDFLVLVGIVAIVVFAFYSPAGWLALAASRIILLPLVAGIAYEILRVADRPWARRWFSPLLAPGLAVQRLTTRPADDAQREVAIAALRAALER